MVKIMKIVMSDENLDSLAIKIKREIELKNKTILECNKQFNVYHIHNNDFSIEFRFTLLVDTIIISRVCFINKRNGCMSKCYNIIKQACKLYKINKIVVQSVLTEEMSNWCLKNRFKPNNYCIKVKNYLCGDYEKLL